MSVNKTLKPSRRGLKQLFNYGAGDDYLSITELLRNPKVVNFIQRMHLCNLCMNLCIIARETEKTFTRGKYYTKNGSRICYIEPITTTTGYSVWITKTTSKPSIEKNQRKINDRPTYHKIKIIRGET